MEDVELIQRCIQKDPVAWNEFVKRYSRLILIAAENHLKRYNFSPSLQELEDIRQNVLVSLWKENKLQTVQNQKDISYWLAIVSGNEALSYIRRQKRQGLFKTDSLFEKIDEKELAEIIPSGNPSPADESVNNEIQKRITVGIRSLPTKERLIIKLNIIHGKKYYEIADMLSIPRGTVSTYIKRGKEKLREALKDF